MARRLANDRRFAFGTWKIEILGGFTSALLLLLIAASMAYQSFERLLRPATIHYDQAIAIAVVGLLVNLACARLLHVGDHHGHGHGCSRCAPRSRASPPFGSESATRVPARAGGRGDQTGTQQCRAKVG